MWERRTKGTGYGSWQTPTVEDAGRKGSKADWLKYQKNGRTSGCRLRNQVQMWPTPTVCGNYNRAGLSKNSGNGLATAVRMWPTPAARDSKGANSREHCEKNGTGRKHMDQLASAVAYPDLKFATPQARDYRTGQQSRWENPDRTRNLNDQIGGQLNPTWVEWLIGWPLGWTDLKPLGMDKCQLVQRKHSAG